MTAGSPIPPSVRRRAERLARGLGSALHDLEMSGPPEARAVVRAVDEEILDGIVVGAPRERTASPAAERFIAQLVHDAPVTVIVLRPTRARKERVLVALDVDTADAQHQVLHDQLLDVAPGLAGPTGEIRVAHAWELFGESALGASGFLDTKPTELDDMLAAERARLDAKLSELVAASGISTDRVKTMLLHGPRTDQIRAALERTRSTILVIGTVGRHGLRGLLVGNTAEALLRAVECSVAVVRVPVLD